jgi:chromate transporter
MQVDQRKWMDEDQFTELFAIGQGLPGPTSTQLVVSTALARSGPVGGLSALMLWNLPGLIILTACGTLLDAYIDPDDPPFWLVGLPPAAVALVFKAMYGFSKNLDSLEMTLTLIAGLLAVLISGGDQRIPSSASQYVFPLSLLFGGMVTYIDSKRTKPWSTYQPPNRGWEAESDRTFRRIGIPLWVGGIIFLSWAVLLTLVICLVQVGGIKNVYLEIFEVMFRIGSIIFGGGQVVLPLLQDEVVPKWMTKQQFLQGLGLAQSMPGPLFNFAAYLGAVYQGIPGALVGFLGIFGPGIILIFAAVPFWARLRHVPWFRSTLKGVNAAAIGLVGAACILLWEAAVSTTADALVFSLAGYCTVVWDLQAPLVIILGGILGAILHQDALSLGQVNFCLSQ